jgi:polysaccharide deacetylase family protein (PEP-CTERM system associated)
MTRIIMKSVPFESGTPASAAVHHFTVDVEEYFHASALASVAPPSRWESLESRVEASTMALLELLGERDARATFFVLGWVAERRPALVRALADAGHEIASHGQDHRLIADSQAGEFRLSVRRSRAVLEVVTGSPVLGFRAPSFSIVRGCEWALDILLEEGYRYDSSLFPVRRRGYGYLGGPPHPHWVERPGGRLYELPPATLRRAGRSFPAGGGGWFRLLPYALVRSALRDHERAGIPGTFYIHPWELDDGQPRLPVSRLTRVRHYGGLTRTTERLRRLLREFRFRTIAQTLDGIIGEDHARPEQLAPARPA